MKVLISLVLTAAVCLAEELPLVTGVEFQPLAAQVSRVLQALELVGEPLPAADAAEVQKLIQQGSSSAKTIEQLQRILDKYCLVGVDINPESRVKVQQGQAGAVL